MGRKVRTVVTCLLLCFALLCVLGGAGQFLFWSRVESHRPCRFEVDLATVGEYRGVYDRRYKAPHGLQMRIEVTPTFQSDEEMQAALEGFKGGVQLKASGNDALASKALLPVDLVERIPGGCAACDGMPDHTPSIHLKDGLGEDWTGEVCLLVQEPAPAMKGRKQSLTMAHVYCMTEAGLTQLFAGVVLIVGLVCGFAGYKVAKGSKRKAPSQDA